MLFTLILLLGHSLVALDSGPFVHRGDLKPRAMGTLVFHPDGTLFIGDAPAAKVYAVDMRDHKAPAEPIKPFRLMDVEPKVAALLGTDPADIMIHDLATHPISHAVFFTVSRGRDQWDNDNQLPNHVAAATIMVRLDPPDRLSVVELVDFAYAETTLVKPVVSAAGDGGSDPVDTITDMVFHDGRLLVAGLSSEVFASSLRILPFPFGPSDSITSLEIFHGVDGKYITQAPIRAMLVYHHNGADHLLAAYMCTPLVTMPMSAMVDGAHVKGETLAELGFGNVPLDLLAYENAKGARIVLANNVRELMVFDGEALATTSARITQKTKAMREGLAPQITLGVIGVQQMADFDNTYFLILKRAANGKLNLRMVPKAAL